MAEIGDGARRGIRKFGAALQWLAGDTELVERGVIPCRKCERPHNAYKTRGSKFWGSWAYPDDGHYYEPMSNYELASKYRLVPR